MSSTWTPIIGTANRAFTNFLRRWVRRNDRWTNGSSLTFHSRGWGGAYKWQFKV